MSKNNESETLDESQIAKYKKVITKDWNKSREAIINVGKSLLEAKEANHKSTFNKRSYDKLVDEELPFTRETAYRLMKIAKCEWIVSGEHNDSLPVSWGSLYEISQLSKEQFLDGVKSKTITANSPRSAIEKYKKSIETPEVSASSKESSESPSEDTSKVTQNVEKKKGDFLMCNISIHSDYIGEFDVGGSLDVDKVRKFQIEIQDAVSKISKHMKIDFESSNAKIESIEDKEWKETVKLGYDKLKGAVEEGVNNNKEMSEEYLVTPEGKMKMHNDFFKVKDLNFIATKVVEKFGVGCLDKALKDVGFPKPYYDNLRKYAEFETQVAA
jgi:hypothetical protein